MANFKTKATFILVDFNLKLFPKILLSLASAGRVWKHSYCTQLAEKEVKNSLFIFLLLFIYFLGPYPRHMEVLRLGVESEL